jgi:hypothetical protein
MDSKRKQEGDGFPRSKKFTRVVKRADATMELVVELGLHLLSCAIPMKKAMPTC